MFLLRRRLLSNSLNKVFTILILLRRLVRDQLPLLIAVEIKCLNLPFLVNLGSNNTTLILWSHLRSPLMDMEGQTLYSITRFFLLLPRCAYYRLVPPRPRAAAAACLWRPRGPFGPRRGCHKRSHHPRRD